MGRLPWGNIQALLITDLVAAKSSAFQCQRAAAAVMTLIQSAKLNGHHPHAYLKDVLTRLPTQMNNAIDELLLHNWKQAITNKV